MPSDEGNHRRQAVPDVVVIVMVVGDESQALHERCIARQSFTPRERVGVPRPVMFVTAFETQNPTM